MRIGIVSDIHGNAAGLQRALDRMGDVDELLCVGDVVEDFRFSNEAVAILRDRGALCVKGNHDIGLLSPNGTRARSAAHVQGTMVEWLDAQPLLIEVNVSGKKLLMTHASPFAPHTQYVTRHPPELKRFADLNADYVVIGHTHAQMAATIGRSLVINPGSVGQATDPGNDRRLSYAVLDTTTDEVVFDNYTLD
jgi:putative phosphoesterase